MTAEKQAGIFERTTTLLVLRYIYGEFLDYQLNQYSLASRGLIEQLFVLNL